MFTFRSLIKVRTIAFPIIHFKPNNTISFTNPSTSNISVAPSTFNAQLNFARHYAKSKDKKSEKTRNKGIRNTSVQLNSDELSEIINISAYNEQLQKILDKLQEDFIQNLSLRSTTGSVETLKIKVDSNVHELQELAQISRKNAKTIVVNMIAFPQAIPAALRALHTSGMNLNPQQEGTTIFIPVPKVTKEHRENLVKNAKALYIKCRDSLKNVQNEAIRKVKKNSDISEDINRGVQSQLTSVADEYVAKSEKMLAIKQKELIGS